MEEKKGLRDSRADEGQVAKEKPEKKKVGRPRMMSKIHALSDRDLTQRLDKWKGFTAVQLMILEMKIANKSDKEIAEAMQCHPDTIKRHRHKYEKGVWFQEIGDTMVDFLPLAKMSLKKLLYEGNPIVTIAFFKGMGVWKDRHDIHHTADPKKLQADFVKRARGTLGIEAKEQLKEMGMDVDKPVEGEEKFGENQD